MDQHDFIAAIQTALGKTSPLNEAFFANPPKDAEDKLSAFKSRTLPAQKALLNILIEQAGLVNMQVFPVENVSAAALSIRELVRSTTPEWGTKKTVAAWDHPLINRLNLKDILGPDNVDVFITKGGAAPDSDQRKIIRRQIIDAYIGITSADFCVARSAALVLRNRPDMPRAVSLVPSIHVAVIGLHQVIENLSELYFRLKWDPKETGQGLSNCMTLISGPSKTADIELFMVHGAHGPRQLAVYVIME